MTSCSFTISQSLLITRWWAQSDQLAVKGQQRHINYIAAMQHDLHCRCKSQKTNFRSYVKLRGLKCLQKSPCHRSFSFHLCPCHKGLSLSPNRPFYSLWEMNFIRWIVTQGSNNAFTQPGTTALCTCYAILCLPPHNFTPWQQHF